MIQRVRPARHWNCLCARTAGQAPCAVRRREHQCRAGLPHPPAPSLRRFRRCATPPTPARGAVNLLNSSTQAAGPPTRPRQASPASFRHRSAPTDSVGADHVPWHRRRPALSPTPSARTATGSARHEPGTRTAGQAGPVPLAYGRCSRCEARPGCAGTQTAPPGAGARKTRGAAGL